MDVLGAGQVGYQRAQDRMEDAAVDLARADQAQEDTQANKEASVQPEDNSGEQGSVAPTPESNRSEEALIEIKQAEVDAKAAAEVIQKGNQALGVLSDTASKGTRVDTSA